MYPPGATSFGVSGWNRAASSWICSRPVDSSHWPPPYAPIPFSSQYSYVAKSRSIVPKREGFTLTVRGGQRSARMSSTEWMIASQVTLSAVGLEHRLGLGRERRVLEPRVRERLDHATVEVVVGWVVDDRAAVLALEVDRVDALELLELGEDVVRPVGAGIELEAKAGVELEKGAEPRRVRWIAEPARCDEGHRSRIAADGGAERAAGLPEREVERSALERPAPVVDVRVYLRLGLEEGLPVQVARERLERPIPGEGQDRAAGLLRVLLASVVGHVLAEPFLAGSREADHRRLARELGADGVRVTVELVALDDEREVADRVEQTHSAA